MPLKGAKAHIGRLKNLDDITRKEVGAALFTAADLIRVEAQISITRGAVSGKGHVVSKPGQPPNADTHTLANYINIEHRTGALKATVRSDAEYSAPLEFGTSVMAARPFMRPARDKKKKDAQALVQQALNRANKRSRSSDQ